MIKGSKLSPRIPKVCNSCSKNYLARQQNSKNCDSCRAKKNIRFPCKCGCGKNASKVLKYEGFYKQCWAKGKTYSEIYDKEVSCGFKRGLENPNFTRGKLNYGRVHKNSKGELFRSSLEVSFSEFCIKNNFEYEYETIIPMINGKNKIVDFKIGEILIEVSGFAYEKWRNDFIYKMSILRQSVDNPILLLTYPKNIEIIGKCDNINVFREDIFNEHKILKKIELFLWMQKINKTLLCN